MEKIRIDLIVEESDQRQRIDLFLSERFSDVSRSRIKKAILSGEVLLNGQKVRVNQKLTEGDSIRGYVPEVTPIDLSPCNLGIPIVYEDEHIVIINKPRGIVVHPADSVKDPTVINDLLFKGIGLAPVSEIRPGVVHRIDRYTSGLVIFSRTIGSHEKMSALFREKKILKKYIALCYNVFKKTHGIINMPVGRNRKDRRKMTVTPSGKEAETWFEQIAEFDGYSLVKVDIKTGRTHQIRVHMAKVGHPIVGDGVYGPETNLFGLTGQFLHAGRLSFEHPMTDELIDVKVAIPEELDTILRKLGYESEIIL